MEKIKQSTLDRLDEYSCSVPTGVRPGKVWKCDLLAYTLKRQPGDPEKLWLIREYMADGPDHCKIEDRRPVIV